MRALLGMPEAEGENPTFARMVPPVGFQYHLHPPTVKHLASLTPFEDTVPSAFDEAQTSELPSSEGILAGAAPASLACRSPEKVASGHAPTVAPNDRGAQAEHA